MWRWASLGLWCSLGLVGCFGRTGVTGSGMADGEVGAACTQAADCLPNLLCIDEQCGRPGSGDDAGNGDGTGEACTETQGTLVTATPARGDTGEGSGDLSGSCGGTGAPEAIWILDWPTRGNLRVTTAGSSFDTVLYVLTGCSGGQELACNDDAGAGSAAGSAVAIEGLEAGRYFIVVDGFAGARGTYQLVQE